jgi:NDP-sugar pyrophosphorylase family protein
MVLAAGFGTRLQPITHHLPKPLVPVLGRPLLELIVLELQAAGVREIGLNTHHLAAEVTQGVDVLQTECAFTIFHEPEILGTGGALANASGFLRAVESFLLHNGDVLTNLDLTALSAEHARHDALATLALADWEPVNSVLVAPDGSVLDIDDRRGSVPRAHDRFLTYSGVAVLSREILRFIPATGYSSLVDALIAVIAEHPGAVRGYAPEGLYWNDLGTVERYLDAHRRLLVEGAARLRWLPPFEDAVFRGADVEVAADARLSGFLSLGSGSRVGPAAALEDCVVLAGASVPRESSFRRAVVGSGWTAQAVGAVGAGGASPDDAGLLELDIVRAAGIERDVHDVHVERITGHGSDRSFWRLAAADHSAVLMRTTAEDAEFSRYVAIASFLERENLGGPRIIGVDQRAFAVLMEDLGDTSLYRRLHPAGRCAEPTRAERGALFRQVLDLLVELQSRGTSAAASCPELCSRPFDYETLRWETDYFRRRFLVELAGLPAAELAGLDDEFHRLAEAVLTQPTVLMHRDYQSQNIHLKDGSVRLVDFQGMRQGPLVYDPVSLLRDSYVKLEPREERELMAYYRDRLQRRGGPSPTMDEWREFVTLAGLQRHMQSLGAFAFLSRVKGKKRFRRHIPLALRHLASDLRELREGGFSPGRLPRLEAAVADLL